MTERKPPARIASLDLERQRRATAKRKAQEPLRPVCRHGVPLELDCAECHGIGDDEGNEGAA